MTTENLFTDEEALVMSIDTDGMTEEEVMSGGTGGAVDRAGWYHLQVARVTKYDDEGKLPCLRVDMQVVGANPENADQIGKYIYHRLYLRSWQDEGKTIIGPLKDGAKKGLLRFALGMEIADKSLLGTPQFQVCWGLLEGRQCVAEVKEEESEITRNVDGNKVKEKKKEYRIPWNEVYPVSSEQSQNVALSEDHLALLDQGGFDDSLVDQL